MKGIPRTRCGRRSCPRPAHRHAALPGEPDFPPGGHPLIPLFIIWTQLGLRDTHLGLMLAYVYLNLAMVIWMLRGFLLDFPVELEEAAWVDGASRLTAFTRVILPLIAPGVAATAVLGLIFSWNEFLFALALSARHARPVTVTVYNFMHFGCSGASSTLPARS